MHITIHNNYHKSEARVHVSTLPCVLSARQVRRVRATLCGIPDCPCLGSLCEQGPQDVRIISGADPNGEYRVTLDAPQQSGAYPPQQRGAKRGAPNYTHTESSDSRQHLTAGLRRLWARHITVIEAWSRRRAVPNSYAFASTVHAPYYRFRRGIGMMMVDGALQSRPHGGTIPAHFRVRGADTPTPDGFRCIRRDRDHNYTEFVK